MSEQKNNQQPAPEQDLTQQAAVRRQKLADMRAAGFDPGMLHCANSSASTSPTFNTSQPSTLS